jgi:WD40 repeat protein
MRNGRSQRRFKGSPLDLFFRYDFFISYRWSDGRTYAVRLRDQLEERGFVVFLDSSDYAKGDNWRDEGRRALARSSRLLLVASPDIFKSEPVRHEVEIFAGLGRRILPIDIAGTLGTAERSEPLLQHLPSEILRFVEPAHASLDHGPSTEVLDDIVRSYELIRQHTRRLRILLAIIVVLASSVVAAGIAGIYAEMKRRQAIAEREAKEWQRLVAEGERASATLDDRSEWATGLALAATSSFDATRARRTVPRGLHFALLRGVWAATPYRVLSRDLNPSARAHVLPDGRVVALADGNAIELIDPRTSNVTVLPLAGVPAGARRVSFSADMQLILVLGQGRTVGVWRADGTLLRTIEAPDDLLETAVFAGSDAILTSSPDGVVRKWSTTAPRDDGSDGAVVLRVQDGIVRMAVTPRGDRVAIADDAAPEAGLKIYELAGGEGKPLGRTQSSRTTALAFSSDGTRLVSADDAGDIRLWDAHTREPLQQTRPTFAPTYDLAFSPDGTRIAIGSFDKSVHVWEPSQKRHRSFYGHRGPVVTVSFSPDGRHVLSSSDDASIRQWDIARHDGVLEVEGRMSSLCGHAATNRGDRIATITSKGRAQIVDTSSGKSLGELGDGDVISAALSPDGARLVAARQTAPPLVWNAVTKAEPSVLQQVTGVKAVSFPSSDRVLFVGTNGVAGMWNTGDKVQRLPVSTGRSVYAIGSSSDGKRLATASAGGFVQVWNEDGSVFRELSGNTIFGDTICFARNGNRLLTGGGDGIAYVWDLQSGKRLLTLAGHDDFVNTAMFSRDEKLIYTSSGDGTVRVWDADDGAQVGRLVVPGPATEAIELEGGRLAVSTNDQTWIASTKVDDLLRAACSVLETVDSIDRIPPATLRRLKQDCAQLVR